LLVCSFVCRRKRSAAATKGVTCVSFTCHLPPLKNIHREIYVCCGGRGDHKRATFVIEAAIYRSVGQSFELSTVQYPDPLTLNDIFFLPLYSLR